MFVIAIETELNSLASCAETNVMTRNGYQIITENEVFFVSRERFLTKYKGNLYLTPGKGERLLTFSEASLLRDSVIRLENRRLIKVKGSNRSEIFTRDGADYHIVMPSSDVEINAERIRCEYRGNNSNIKIVTKSSSIDATASHSTFDIHADETTLTMYVSGCFVDLCGKNLEVMIIGSNNTICGITDDITVFSRGRKNTFFKKHEAPTEDPVKIRI